MKIQEKEISQKNVIFYKSFLKAWIDNRMEHDKKILALSSLGIALLSTFHENLNLFIELLFLSLSAFSYLISLVLTLLIFSKNSDYILSFINSENNHEAEQFEKKLERKTFFSFLFFVLGSVFLISLIVLDVFLKIYK